MAALLLGVDLGTTATKAALLDAEAGAVLAECAVPTVMRSTLPGHAEVDVGQWEQSVPAAIAGVVASAGATTSDIAGVAFTGMVPAVLLLDRLRRPLRPAILQNDARATAELAQLREELAGLDLLRRTGSTLSQQSVAPTALWLARHEATVWRDTALVMGSYDWAATRLGARPTIERNWAIESGLFDLGGRPEPEVLERAGIPPERLAPVAASGEVVGHVDAAGSEWSGLRRGTTVVVGGADHVLAAWAAGLHRAGPWLVKLGGGGDILTTTDEPVVDERLYLDAHVVPGLWMPNGCMATSGSLVRWFSELMGVPPSALDEEAAAVERSTILCLPYFLGEKSPLHDPDLRGAFLGLGLDSTRGALFRSVLEGVAFGFRRHRDILRETGAPLAAEALIGDGGSRSALWRRIHADVLGVPVVRVVGETGAAIGAAAVAGIACGLLDGWDAVAAFSRFGDRIEPDPRSVRSYDVLYDTWCEAGAAVAPVSHRLARRSRA